MKLKELLKNIKVDSDSDQEVLGIVDDSRLVRAGYVFIASSQGERFAGDAIANGAIFVLNESKTVDFAQKCQQLIDTFYKTPNLKIVGITGTNGKTTTAHFIYQMLEKVMIPSAVCGTLGYKTRNTYLSLENTTPSYLILRYLIFLAEQEGVEYFIFEVSSHALKLNRLHDIKLDYFIFTGIASDHLDFHHNFANYLNSKLMIKGYLKFDGVAIINGDDANAHLFVTKKYFYYGLNNCYIPLNNIKYKIDSIEFDIANYHFHLPFGGNYNLANFLAGMYLLLLMNIDITTIQKLTDLQLPAGRLELVASDPLVYIDFAHTEHAVNATLEHLKSTSSKPIVAVIGCGGERDQEKRAPIGRVVSSIAEITIITTDNPRGEDPMQIANMVADGIIDNKNCIIELDRRKAIKLALEHRDKLIIILGKGHEKKQIFNNHSIAFDDKEVVNESIRELYFNN